MNVNEYQEKALSTAVYPGQGTLEGLKYAALGLAGEVGELANKLKKHLRNGTAIDNEALVDELGDVLWYCAAVARECKTPLSSVAMRNLEKLASRKEKGELKEHPTIEQTNRDFAVGGQEILRKMIATTGRPGEDGPYSYQD